MRTKIEILDIMHKKYVQETKKLKEKSTQCIADRNEITRDLATYEINFARHNKTLYNEKPFKAKFMNMLEKVLSVRNNCQKNLKYDENGIQYFTDSSFSIMNDTADCYTVC